MTPSTINCAITAFLLAVVSIEMGYSRPLKSSTCEGKVLADGFFTFNLPPSISKNVLESGCELLLIIEGRNRAIYEDGRVPVKVQDPVKTATIYNFTLDTCPESVVLNMECPKTLDITQATCFCVNSTASPVTSTTSLSTITAVTVSATIASSSAIFMVVLGICIWRKKIPLHCCVRDCVQGSSYHLQEEQDAMIDGTGHDINMKKT